MDGGSLQPAVGFDVLDVNPRKATSVHLSARSLPWGATLQGKVYFAGSNHDHGVELWVTDGTPAGTKLAVDLASGTQSSWPSALFAHGNALYFAAYDGTTWAFYRSDGTPAGTRSLGALPTGNPNITSYVDIAQTFDAGDRVCVWANASPSLWCTDTAQSSIAPVSMAGSTPLDADVVSTGNYALLRTQSQTVRTDGTNAGTTTLPLSGAGVRGAVAVGNRILLTAHPDSDGRTVWVTDGTTEGTRKVDAIPKQLDNSPNPAGGQVRLGNSVIVHFDGKLYTVDPATLAVTSIAGAPTPHSSTELVPVTESRVLLLQEKDVWVIEGTPATATKIATVDNGPYDQLQGWATGAGAAFFWDGERNKGRIWRSDGTPAGTRALGTMQTLGPAVYPPESFSTPPRRVIAADWLFFSCEDEGSWPTACAMKFADGKLSVIPVEDRTASSNPGGFYPLEGGGAVFAANGSYSSRYPQTWFTDGTQGGTRRVSETTLVGPPVKLGDRYFILRQSKERSGCELAAWRDDPASMATVQYLEDFACDPSGGTFDLPMVAVGNRIFFADANESVLATDGTATGASKQGNLPRVTEGARWLVRDGALYLPTSNGLQKADATGQVLATLGSGKVRAAGEAGGSFVFGGERLFVSDGTPAGTTQVPSVSDVTYVHVAAPHRAFVLARKIVYRVEGESAVQIASDVEAIVPFRDGVAIDTFNAGLQVVFGNSNSPTRVANRAEALYVHGDRLYFAPDSTFIQPGDKISGEPWVSDGTPAGTRALGELLPEGSPRLRWLGTMGDAAFLAADTERHGRELLRFK
ncbi:hypothetical protein LVJ94_51610 [Pendulispora rubella]|uniref:Uncharacterized protein n=1 Tax=Pendulispora rubella TaxID=2741070 RepID=A0ABZ2L316_9BACT